MTCSTTDHAKSLADLLWNILPDYGLLIPVKEREAAKEQACQVLARYWHDNPDANPLAARQPKP